MFLKICGVTRLADARHAVEQGATAIGFVFWSGSPRYIEPIRAAGIMAALPVHVTTVGVFVNETVKGIKDVIARTGLRLIQLHGDETPSHAAALERPVIRAVTLERIDEAARVWPVDTLWLLDSSDPARGGGTRAPIDWTRAADAARQRRVILAGGLTPENVAEAIGVVRPYGVDVSSGVEDAPGVKNPEKVTRFVSNARRAFDTR
jgi:phosphoribosylanthranilate isomerase